MFLDGLFILVGRFKLFLFFLFGHRASQVALVVKYLPVNAGDVKDLSSVPGSGIFPGEGNGNPLQYSGLRIPWTEDPTGLQPMGSQRVGHD